MATALDRIKALDKERAELFENAKSEAMTKANEAVANLNALGFDYHLAEGKKRKATGVRQIKDAPCSVCGFKTNPIHDARKHRAQGKKKRAFTAQELKDLNLTKV